MSTERTEKRESKDVKFKKSKGIEKGRKTGKSADAKKSKEGKKSKKSMLNNGTKKKKASEKVVYTGYVENDKPNKTNKTGKKVEARRELEAFTDNGEHARTNHEKDVQKLESIQEHSYPVFLHGLSALSLPGKDVVRAMDDSSRHVYLTQVSKLCERLLALMHSVLVSSDDRAATELPSLHDHVTADLLRLRHLPTARRCIEMTLWHHVSRFNSDCLSRVQAMGYGAPVEPKAAATKVGLTNHNEECDGAVFNSFRNRYMSNVLETYQEDLETIRQNESLDEEHVLFLRRCIDAGADLFAHICAWDRQNPLAGTSDKGQSPNSGA